MHTELERKFVVLTGACVGIAEYSLLCASPGGLKIPPRDREVVYNLTHEVGGYVNVKRRTPGEIAEVIRKIALGIIVADIPVEYGTEAARW